PSKDDIFFALAEEGFRLLFAYGEIQDPASDDSAETISRMFLRYYAFSKEHPEYFALMFLDRRVPKISKNWDRFGFVGAMKHDMAARIERAIAGGAFPEGTSPHAVFRIMLNAIHGVATLNLCDRLAPGEDPDLLARATLDTVVMGLQAGAALHLDVPP